MLMRKNIEVVAAIIQKDNQIFATERGYGSFQGQWEFPGGKMETGETREEALVREIKEELMAEINIKEYFMTIEYDYPEFHLTMHCFMCELVGDEIRLVEHSSAKWLTKEELNSVPWLPADVDIIEKLREIM